jgi:hypothetical protein
VTAVAIAGIATNSSPSPEELLIVPGVSVGKVRKGMTTNEVETVLGKPEKWQGKIMVYDGKLGMSVGQTKNGAMMVFCGSSMLHYAGVKKFRCRTKEGIGMESSRADIIKAFGKPSAEPQTNPGQTQLEYASLGLTFTLESDKVINILVLFRPDLSPDDSPAAWTIEPGVGVGKIKAGMTAKQVTDVLGAPDETKEISLLYRRYGFSVVTYPEGKAKAGQVHIIMLVDAAGFNNPAEVDPSSFKKFLGQTKEDIRLGSSREDIIRAYGKPSDTMVLAYGRPANTNIAGQNLEVLKYNRPLGLDFELTGSKATKIVVIF